MTKSINKASFTDSNITADHNFTTSYYLVERSVDSVIGVVLLFCLLARIVFVQDMIASIAAVILYGCIKV